MCTWKKKTNNKNMPQNRSQMRGAESKCISHSCLQMHKGHQVEEVLDVLSGAPEGKTGGVFFN